MLRKSFVLMVVGTVIFFFCSLSSADVPDSINYQGKLTTASGGCLNDTVQMTFTIYADEAGTMSEWTETQTQVEVKEGIFSVFLGSVNPLPDILFDGSVKYLAVQVESDPEMSPLKPMVTTAYAFHCATADSALNAPAAGIVSVDGVSNPGGDVDLIQQDAITISPNDGANTIIFGETHSARTDNPHMVNAAQTGALVSVDGVSNAGGNVDFIAGTNMTITPNDGANTVTFSSAASGIGGSGTTNYIPKFTASTTLGNSVMYESGGNIGIGTTATPTRLSVAGLPPTGGYYTMRYNPSNGAIYFLASSERYKRDIQSLKDDFSAILRAKPKSFVDAASGKREIGFIAEEFDALGLRNLVIYLDGQPNGIKYEMISLYLVEVVKELQAKNEDLRKRIEALEAR